VNADNPVKRSTLHFTRDGLVKVNLQDGKENGRLNPSIEWQKQISTYKISQCVNAIIHIPSAYTLGVLLRMH
jgi:vacuolar-type H+-ATPase catalytic subunit A/Vma1